MAKAKKLPSGNWRVQAKKTINGNVIVKSFTASTSKQAELSALEWQAENKTQTIENITLKAAYERYINSKSKVLSPNTIREYSCHSRNYLQSIMELRLSDLTNEKIQAAINIDAVGRSPKTVRNISGLLSAVLKMFMPGFIFNVALPKKEKPDLYIPTEQEVKIVIEAAKGTDMELPILLAAFGPMRRGEICALTDKDINGCTVTINKSMALNDKREWVIKSPKTTAGFRKIVYPDFMHEMLTSIKGKVYPKNPNILTDNFENIIKKSNVNSFRFHDLRHYCVSFLHSKNVPTKYIMARGGWETEAIVNNIYNHILTDKDKEMTEHINAELSSIFK